MKTEDVKKLPVKRRLLYWIVERQQIYLKRQFNRPKPWTDDEILQTYKFCNVIRMNDRVSKWLLDNWYLPNIDHPNMLLACTLARQLNNIDAMEAVGFPKLWNPHHVQKALEDRAEQGLKNYSAAYMITANYGDRGRAPETKAYQTVWRVCDPVYKNRPKIWHGSMEETWKELLPYKGFSSFIAGQVVADLRHGVSCEWHDRNMWAPAGPGSMRGINRYNGWPIDRKHDQSSFIAHMMAAWAAVEKVRGVPDMEAIDFQNCLCEFDKYERVLHGEGRPKTMYNGKGE